MTKNKMPSKEVLQRMYIDEDMTQRQIAREFDVSLSTVYKYICKYDMQYLHSCGARRQ